MTIKRIQDFQKLGFGLFIHWGLFSIGNMGEWIWKMSNMDQKEYYKYLDQIDNLDIDFDKILKMAKDSGVKYAVFTTRHHDGFSLYDTKELTKYDINMRIDKRDFVKEFVISCKKYDIKPHLYHTTLDWSLDEFENDFDSYLNYLNKSVEILTKNYGDINGFWFDGNWSKKDIDWKEDVLYSMIRKNQPNTIITNNTGMQLRGKLRHQELDVLTYEQGKLDIDEPNVGKPVAREVCQTFNDHWGSADNDFNHKAFKDILERFVKARHYNANYLLNIGPDMKGNVPPIDVEIFRLMGIWIRKYGFMLFEGKIIHLLNGKKENKNSDFVVDFKGKKYLFLYNIKSGGHVNAIEYGSSILEKRKYSNCDFDITKIVSLDNNCEIKFKKRHNNLEISPVGFEYGYNTIIRVYAIE